MRDFEKMPAVSDAASHVPLDEQVQVTAVREEIAVGVESVETGAVRVRTVVHESMHDVPVSLRSEKVSVERIPVGRAVDRRAPPRQEGNSLIIPVYEYLPVVRMQLTLKEEVRVTTVEAVEQTSQSILSRAEELVVERREGATGEWQREDGVGACSQERPLRR